MKQKPKKKGMETEELLSKADLILMEYPELMSRLKKVGYYICLKEITPLKSKTKRK